MALDDNNGQLVPENGCHVIYSKDPDELLQYLYKQVCIKTSGIMEHVGWVYTIDPVSESIVLVRFDNEFPIMNVVMGHVVESISVINDNVELHRADLDRLFSPEYNVSLNTEEVLERRNKVKDWLVKNRLPVVVSAHDENVLSVADALTIEPPYAIENCCSTNEIILGKIQGLLKNMPEGADTWL